MNWGVINYATAAVPPGYVCSRCSAASSKLWRQYQTFLNHIELLCVDCAGADQHKDVSEMDADGRYVSEHGWRIDQIGWLVPAIPTEEGDTYWGYTSVPEAGVRWWRALPTRFVL